MRGFVFDALVVVLELDVPVEVDPEDVVVGAFHPASIATNHQKARPFCSQLVYVV